MRRRLRSWLVACLSGWAALCLVPVAVGLPGCVTPYRPAKVQVPQPPPPDIETRILDVLRDRGYRIATHAIEPLRLQTNWAPHQREDVPGWKRATLFMDEPGTLHLLVEVRYLNLDLFARPYRTDPSGDRDLELSLQRALRDALQ